MSITSVRPMRHPVFQGARHLGVEQVPMASGKWQGWDGMGWDGMGWDGMGWDAMRCDAMRCDAMAKICVMTTPLSFFFARIH